MPMMQQTKDDIVIAVELSNGKSYTNTLTTSGILMPGVKYPVSLTIDTTGEGGMGIDTSGTEDSGIS